MSVHAKQLPIFSSNRIYGNLRFPSFQSPPAQATQVVYFQVLDSRKSMYFHMWESRKTVIRLMAHFWNTEIICSRLTYFASTVGATDHFPTFGNTQIQSISACPICKENSWVFSINRNKILKFKVLKKTHLKKV